MQKFMYTAADSDNKKLKGTYIAENEKELRSQLAKQRLYLLKARRQSEKPEESFFSVCGRVRADERNVFCRQLAVMVNSGIPVAGSIGILKEQRSGAHFRRILNEVHKDLKSGLMLSEAMSKHPKAFPDFLTGMTSVGEKSGALGEVLTAVAEYYETDARIKKKFKSAMLYPCVLLALIVGILVLMVAFVIPSFENSLTSLEVEMPAVTVKVMELSRFVRAFWKELFLAAAAFFSLLAFAVRTKKGKYIWHTVLLNLPVFGKVQRELISARFARSFGLMLESGANLTDAMRAVIAVFGNKNVEKHFAEAFDNVKQGQDLTAALDECKLFPRMLIQMVSVGEKTGAIGKVLLRSCSYFDEQAESSLTSISQLVQPVLFVAMGGLIGFLFYTIYAPMLSIMTLLE